MFESYPFEIKPSEKWSDDLWYINQKERNLIDNNGYLIINEGEASGTIIGANLCTLNLLQGTEYFPGLENSVLFLEDDETTTSNLVDRDLQSLIHLPNFKGVKGLVIGRFQKKSELPDDLLIKIVKTKKELDAIPVLANVDFGHADPKITFPVGGTVRVNARKENPKLEIIEH